MNMYPYFRPASENFPCVRNSFNVFKGNVHATRLDMFGIKKTAKCNAMFDKNYGMTWPPLLSSILSGVGRASTKSSWPNSSALLRRSFRCDLSNRKRNFKYFV